MNSKNILSLDQIDQRADVLMTADILLDYMDREYTGLQSRTLAPSSASDTRTSAGPDQDCGKGVVGCGMRGLFRGQGTRWRADALGRQGVLLPWPLAAAPIGQGAALTPQGCIGPTRRRERQAQRLTRRAKSRCPALCKTADCQRLSLLGRAGLFRARGSAADPPLTRVRTHVIPGAFAAALARIG